MTLGQTARTSRTITRRDLIWALIVATLVLIAIAALVGAFGLPQAGPTYEIVPDPAGPLGF